MRSVELTAEQKREWRRLEDSIRIGLAEEKAIATVTASAQRSIGLALKEIRDRRFYRHTHEKFEVYCKEQWGFTKQRANQLIAATTVVVAVENERQARELLAYPAQVQEEAWAVASSGGKPTATAVKDALADLTAADIKAEEEAALKIFRAEAPQDPIVAARASLSRAVADVRAKLVIVSVRLKRCVGDVDVDQVEPELAAAIAAMERMEGVIQGSAGEVRAAA